VPKEPRKESGAVDSLSRTGYGGGSVVEAEALGSIHSSEEEKINKKGPIH
jgi:hypothetical protein